MSLLVQEIVKMGELQLSEAGIDTAKVEAERLYCHLKKIDRSKFILRWSKLADDREVELYMDLISQRAKGIPLQHVMGEVDFMGYTIKVTEDVLVPRMETEVVVLEAEKFLKPRNAVLDLCCGSGVIGIALAKGNNIKLTSSDLSSEAIELTKENCQLNGVKSEVLQGDLFEPIGKKSFHVIVSNPPYIRSDVIPTLDSVVKDYDPLLALDGGEDGLDFYRKIVREAPLYLKRGGVLVFEIGHDQGEAVSSLMEEDGTFNKVQVVKDLAGMDRVVTGRLVK